ncbi:unnamed protein product [Lactuca saligna]|uniref:Alpha/beta hydrolase fold-3 domain-containing protein n=1 Tax=Lactuca saligna TaxID=75948 RepID=A0AA35VLB5_LACSI|nr:unnamed protein product [Lactuca saligna]
MSNSLVFPLNFNGLLVHSDGRIVRSIPNDNIAAGTDTLTGVQSKDVVISHESNVFVRLYIPKTLIPTRKLPTLIYYHGGAFVTDSAASPTYHQTLNLITTESNVIVVSVNYRLAPEYPLPIAYEDSWEAITWVASHVGGNGPESWLNDHADLQNVFLGGDSAGANIAHNMAIRVGLNHEKVINIEGVVLLHPYFGGMDPIGAESKIYKRQKELIDMGWLVANPSGNGLDDPLFNPGMDPNSSAFGSSKILVCVAEKDPLRERGLSYKKVMETSGWKGKVELMESKGERHVFFLINPSCENSRSLRNRICNFINPIRSKA